MRANPYDGTDIAEETYMGDNFVRHSGDAVNFENVNKFAWQSRAINGQKSDGIHLQSNPTMTELAFKQFNAKKFSVQDKFKRNLTERYGGQHHLLSNRDQHELALIYGQSEAYREYGADGRITKGQPILIPQSKYEEDKYIGNHTSIWGSYYDLNTGQWGYACCQCCIFNAYCTGNDGINAKQNNFENNEENRNDKRNKLDKMGQIGVIPKPKELENADKLVNPSGYISTRGIMAAKGLARKAQKQYQLQELQDKIKRAKKKKKKRKLYQQHIEYENDLEPEQKKSKLNK